MPPGSPAAVYETVVNNYQQNIVNDYSTEVNQIFNNNGDVDINQAVAGAGGIASTGTIDDSVLAAGGGSNTFGDNTAIGNDNSNVNQSGDVSVSGDGNAVATGQSEADNTGQVFGSGAGDGPIQVQANSDVGGDVTQNANQADVDITGTGGAGGAGGASGDGFDHSPINVDIDQQSPELVHHDAPEPHDPGPDPDPVILH